MRGAVGYALDGVPIFSPFPDGWQAGDTSRVWNFMEADKPRGTPGLNGKFNSLGPGEGGTLDACGGSVTEAGEYHYRTVPHCLLRALEDARPDAATEGGVERSCTNIRRPLSRGL